MRIDPHFAAAHNNLGLALVRTGKVDEGIEHYRKALEIQPGNAEAHNNLGAALARRGNLDEAIAHFQAALEINPALTSARDNKKSGRGSHSAAKRFGPAVEFDPLLDFGGKSVLAGCLGEVKGGLGRFDSGGKIASFGAGGGKRVRMRGSRGCEAAASRASASASGPLRTASSRAVASTHASQERTFVLSGCRARNVRSSATASAFGP